MKRLARDISNLMRPSGLRRAYSILDLLVAVAIIGLLISLLLPSLAKSREHARYVRWQLFSRDMSMDEHMAVYYTFQNDRGNTTVTNMAVANHDPTYLPNSMDLGMFDNSEGLTPATNSAMIKFFWSADGRFKGKPAGSFSRSYVNNSVNLVLTPTVPSGSGMLAGLLRKSQAITIAVWVNIPADAVNQAGSLIWWTDNNGNRAVNIHLPWQNGVYWDTYDPAILWSRVPTPFTYGTDSAWSLWCFTKDNHSGLQKIYLNGQLQAAIQYPTGPGMLWQDLDTSPINPTPTTLTSNFLFGRMTGFGSMIGTVDELAIFDADLSPADTTPTGAIIPGVPAVRFLQMYQMGCN